MGALVILALMLLGLLLAACGRNRPDHAVIAVLMVVTGAVLWLVVIGAIAKGCTGQ